MKRPNYKRRGELFLAVCFFIGLFIYQNMRDRTGGGSAPGADTDAGQQELKAVDGDAQATAAQPTVPAAASLPPATVTSSAPVEAGDDQPTGNQSGNCDAIVLHRVAAIENETSFMEQGETYGSVTQYWRNMRTGVSWFCAHGSYCYPEYVQDGGERVLAIKLTNCAVQPEGADREGDEVLFSIG
ncbi:hypothetical protein [Sphingomonas adhaesiva]|uniref:Uncharacterized protein n=1 Tax=Sphingomonas adhaesiva TaxID=28212 RepID=A0A2A4I408_9SPHN|nr:hypothetical protein [Sphingomonas adhaesiva]PCG12896.1 hypothetical protein COA07_17460 [Sphingomonas adhaesiva]